VTELSVGILTADLLHLADEFDAVAHERRHGLDVEREEAVAVEVRGDLAHDRVRLLERGR